MQLNLWLGRINKLTFNCWHQRKFCKEVINNVIRLKKGKTADIDGITKRKWCGSVAVWLCDLNKNYI